MRLMEAVACKDLPPHGVYYIVEAISKKAASKTTPFGKSVIYIGKAKRELISARCQKHVWSVQDARHASGKPITRPGKAFKHYRKTINFKADNLWVVPGVVAGKKTYLISCAEEYLLFEYHQIHGRYPKANSTG